MITEQDLQAAIAECKGERNPNANTCRNLAAFLTIYDHLYGEPKDGGDSVPALSGYSFAAEPSAPVEKVISYEGDTEFARAVNGRNAVEIWAIMDELMDVLKVTVPRLYKATMRKIED